MTRSEAVYILNNKPNVKIAHRLFDDNEYLYGGDDGMVYDENGYLFESWNTDDWNNGMRIRSGGVWETDWFVRD